MIPLIEALRGAGEGKTALLIGNGPSAGEFFREKDINSINARGIYTIGMNNPPFRPNMIIYYDEEMKNFWNTRDPGCILVGFKNGKTDHTCKRCNFYFSLDNIQFGDTGFHALQIADGILGFSEIMLIGYDYTTEAETHHWYERTGPEKVGRFKKWSIDNVMQKYTDHDWRANITNLNERSALKAFLFRNFK